MDKIIITDARQDALYVALRRSFFKVIDNKQVELEDWEYKAFIMAMFSGNPGVNLNALENRIRFKRKRREGV